MESAGNLWILLQGERIVICQSCGVEEAEVFLIEGKILPTHLIGGNFPGGAQKTDCEARNSICINLIR